MGVRPLHLRILSALSTHHRGQASYYGLMRDVWPPEQFPRAYRHSVNGGPPGVAMSFGRALNELRQMGLISRMATYLGGERQRFGQEDVWLLSDGRKALREAQ